MISIIFPALAVVALLLEIGRLFLCPRFACSVASSVAILALIDRCADNNLEYSKGRYPSGHG